MRNEPDTRWIVRSLREAAWAPLLVLGMVVLAAGVFDMYTRFPWIDIPTHFLGGIAVTYFFWRACANAQSVARRFANVGQSVLSLGGTATMSILWEFFEFLADHLLGAHMLHGLADTSWDIFFGLAGGVAYLVLRRWLAASTSAHALPDSTDERA